MLLDRAQSTFRCGRESSVLTAEVSANMLYNDTLQHITLQYEQDCQFFSSPSRPSGADSESDRDSYFVGSKKLLNQDQSQIKIVESRFGGSKATLFHL